jgi:hypothetical protein
MRKLSFGRLIEARGRASAHTEDKSKACRVYPVDQYASLQAALGRSMLCITYVS